MPVRNVWLKPPLVGRFGSKISKFPQFYSKNHPHLKGAYELRLLWRTNPDFYAFQPFLLGVGVVFHLLIMGKIFTRCCRNSTASLRKRVQEAVTLGRGPSQWRGEPTLALWGLLYVNERVGKFSFQQAATDIHLSHVAHAIRA